MKEQSPILSAIMRAITSKLDVPSWYNRWGEGDSTSFDRAIHLEMLAKTIICIQNDLVSRGRSSCHKGASVNDRPLWGGHGQNGGRPRIHDDSECPPIDEEDLERYDSLGSWWKNFWIFSKK